MKKELVKPSVEIDCSNEQKKYYTNEKYILREIAGESILVSIGDGIIDFRGIISLNASAKLIWSLLQKGVTQNELVAELCNHFSISEECALQDVKKTLDFLQEKRMVHAD